LGGIDHNGVFRTESPEDAEKQILSAIDEAGPDRLIIAPGCVITVDTPQENIVAVKDAVRSISPFDYE
jgi:uroporphyrinogen-III decarboxylase